MKRSATGAGLSEDLPTTRRFLAFPAQPHQVVLSACRVALQCLPPDFRPCSAPPGEKFDLSLSISFDKEFLNNLLGLHGAPRKSQTIRVWAARTLKLAQRLAGLCTA